MPRYTAVLGACVPLGLEAVHRDDFLLDQLDLSPPTILQVMGAGRPNSVSLSADTSRLADGGRTARRSSLTSRLASRTGYCQQKL